MRKDEIVRIRKVHLKRIAECGIYRKLEEGSVLHGTRYKTGGGERERL